MQTFPFYTQRINHSLLILGSHSCGSLITCRIRYLNIQKYNLFMVNDMQSSELVYSKE